MNINFDPSVVTARRDGPHEDEHIPWPQGSYPNPAFGAANETTGWDVPSSGKASPHVADAVEVEEVELIEVDEPFLDQGDLEREQAASAGNASAKRAKKKGACPARPRQNSIEGALAGVGAPDFARALGTPALPEGSMLQGLLGAAGLATIGLLAPMMAAAGAVAIRGGNDEGELAGFSLTQAGYSGGGPLGSGGVGPGALTFSLVDGLSPHQAEGPLGAFTGAWAVRFDAAWTIPDPQPAMPIVVESMAASVLEVREPPRSGASWTSDIVAAAGDSITMQPTVQGGSAEAPTAGRTGVPPASPVVQAVAVNPVGMAPGSQDHGSASNQPTMFVPEAAFSATASDVVASRPGRPIEVQNAQAADRGVAAVERKLPEPLPAHATGPAHGREGGKDPAAGPLADKAGTSQAETVLAVHPGKGHGNPFEKLADVGPPAVMKQPSAAEAMPVAHPGKGHGNPFEKLADAGPPAVMKQPPAAEAMPVAHPGKGHLVQGEKKQAAELAPASTAPSTVLDMAEMPSGKAHGRQHHKDAGQEPMPAAATPSSMEAAFAMHPGKGQEKEVGKSAAPGPPEALVMPFGAGMHMPAHAGKEQGNPADKTVGRLAEIKPDLPPATEVAAATQIGKAPGNQAEKSIEARLSPPAPDAPFEQHRGKARDEEAGPPAGSERAASRPDVAMPEGPSKGKGHHVTVDDANPAGSRAVPGGSVPDSSKPGRAHEEAGLKGADPTSSIVVVMADMMAPVAPQPGRGKLPGAEAAAEVVTPVSAGGPFAWELHRPEQGKANQGGKGHDAGLPDVAGKVSGPHPAPHYEAPEATGLASHSSHDWSF